MPEFFSVLAPDAALQVLRESLTYRVGAEEVETQGALGRLTAGAILSPERLPAFPRSTMDGFSVRSGDTFGASEALPAYLDVVGEAPMGKASGLKLARGQTARTFTGGMLAEGADAVVMVEHTQVVDARSIEVLRPVAPGENVLTVGEDADRGDLVFQAGHLLRPQDLGGLLALGIVTISVARRPRVAIVSTGDELVPPGARPALGQVRDINTYTISSLVTQAGGIPVPVALVEDDYEAQRDTALCALHSADVVLFSAGSSVSSRDLTSAVFEGLPGGQILVHGISLKPGKPTIVGLADGKPLFGLPGNPVSAMVVFDLLVRPTIYLLGGRDEPPCSPTVEATLSRDVASIAGREDYVQVRLVHENGRRSAEPVFGKSGLIYTLVRADGVVKVPLDSGGLYAGEKVSVRLY